MALVALWLLVSVTGAKGAPVFEESGGLVIIEAENTESVLDLWSEKTTVSGFTGDSYIEFGGNNPSSGPAKSPLEYSFKINRAGLYNLHLHCARELVVINGENRHDVANDGFVRVEGDYGAGPNAGNAHGNDAPLNMLKRNTKFFGGANKSFVWASGNRLDPGGHNNKRVAVYDFKAGETYKLVLSGRSKLFKVNRIMFRHRGTGRALAEELTQPESSIVGPTSQKFDAVNDFGQLSSGTVPYYKDTARGALAINAGNANYRDKFARASLNYTGEAGVYDVSITALKELDGECTYRLLVNGSLVGTATNDETTVDYEAQIHTFRNVAIPVRAVISVESNSVTNGKIPEGTITAYARGRWTTLCIDEASGVGNVAPQVSAGINQNVQLPDNVVFLNGTATDSDGTISSRSWTQISGPSAAQLSGQSTASLTAGNLVAGTYIFRFSATDNSGSTSVDDVQVVVRVDVSAFAEVVSFTLFNADTNSPVAGFDPIRDGSIISTQSIGTQNLNIVANTLPSTDFGSVGFSLSGATTLEHTENGAIWALFRDDSNVVRSGAFNEGLHQLTATPYSENAKGGNVGSALTIGFTVTHTQAATRADAGVDKVVYLPNSSVSLTGSLAQGDGTVSSVLWQQVSGPASASIEAPSQLITNVTSLIEGQYEFQVTLQTSNGGNATDRVLVTVEKFAVTSFTLINSDTDLPVSGYDPIQDGADIYLSGLNPQKLNIRANTNASSDLGRVEFQLTGATVKNALENIAVYALYGDDSGDYRAGSMGLGDHTLVGTAYSQDRTGGVSSDPYRISFELKAGVPTTLAQFSGELKKWHKVTLSWDGPDTSETATENPFSDYRLDVEFTHVATGKSYVVPGYYAADGDSANSHADSGKVWRAHFAPDETGEWSYRVTFKKGTDVAVLDDASSSPSGGFFDADAGVFTILPSDKIGRDHRGKGRLNYVNKHHLQYADTQEYFLKVGSDAPENFLAYEDFDATPNDPKGNPNLRKSWSAHQIDYIPAEAAKYTWDGGKGTEMLGAVNYLSSKGINAFSFLTFSLDGDDDNVFPHRLTGTVSDYENVGDNRRWGQNSVYHDRFDVSKMAQWENVFEYADMKGLFLHFKTQETENETRMDGGAVGRERKLYYRELIARFSHHLALNWNLGEENDNQTVAQKQAMTAYFAATDPYNHLVVIHSYPGRQAEAYDPLIGDRSDLTGASIQTGRTDFANVFRDVLKWVKESNTAGKPWVVSCDEPGDARKALRPAGDEGNSWIDGRKNALWGAIMAGGAGVEFYFGYEHAHSDLTCQDYRSRDGFWDICRIAVEFFQKNDVPFYNMKNVSNVSSSSSSWCLSNSTDTLVVYLKQGGSTNLNLSGYTGDFNVSWYDPRNGGDLQEGSVLSISGGGSSSLGTAPNLSAQDWVVLVRKQGLSSGLDSDNDGLPDRMERVSDFDGDGLADFMDADSDNDGTDDGVEERLGINYLNSSEFFHLKVKNMDSDMVRLSWPSQLGNRFRLRFSSDMTRPLSSWQVLRNNVNGSSLEETVVEVDGLTGRKNFYVIELKN